MSSKSAFVQAPGMGHSFIVNRFDYNQAEPSIGVGIELLDRGEFEIGIALLGAKLATERKERYGQPVTILDGGANMGVFSVFWGAVMGGGCGAPWGRVIAFEPQEWPYYQLCGNICINNTFNVSPRRAALGETAGTIQVPYNHPLVPCNFGGCSLIDDYDSRREFGRNTDAVEQVAIDSLNLKRLDILKLDVEHMEPQAIMGGIETIKRCKPVIIAETLNCGAKAIMDVLPDGYITMHVNAVNALCVHQDDETGDLQRAIAAWKAKAGEKAA